jgi:hypothetical protein
MGEADTNASVTCPHCCHYVSSEVENCPNCGGKLRVVNFCPKCGVVPEKGQKQCASCGESFASTTTTATVQPVTKRPLGLIIMSVLWFLGGLLNINDGYTTLLVDLEMMEAEYFGYGFTSSERAWLAGVIPMEAAIMAAVMLVGIIQFATIAGFLTRRRWSYWLGMAIPIMSIITSVAQALLVLTAPQGYLSVNFMGIGSGVFFAIIFISYLKQPNVRQWLRVDKSNQV